MQDPNPTMALTLVEGQAEARIRRVWHDGRWYFSVIDIVGVLTDSTTPRRYWTDIKRRIQNEGFRELYAKCVQLKMPARDGKSYSTDSADAETLLRIIQSIPSPKAEPVKQWLAKVGARRVEEVTQPLAAPQVASEIAHLERPADTAPAMEWAHYHELMAALYRRQALYEARLTYIDARLDDQERQIGELHSRMESLEAGQRLLPEILERLGPETLTPEHQATVKQMAKRLNELSGIAYATIYGDLNAAYHVGKYSDIPDARWSEVVAWFQQRLDAAERRRIS